MAKRRKTLEAQLVEIFIGQEMTLAESSLRTAQALVESRRPKTAKPERKPRTPKAQEVSAEK